LNYLVDGGVGLALFFEGSGSVSDTCKKKEMEEEVSSQEGKERSSRR